MAAPMPLVRNLPAPEYHAHPAINKTGLDLIHKAPAKYKYSLTNKKAPTEAMIFGNFYHLRVLEAERFKAEVVGEPEDAPKRPTIQQRQAAKPAQKTLDQIAFWDEWDVANEDKLVVTSEDMAKLNAMYEALMSNRAARRIIEKIQEFESVLFWKDKATGLDARARLDGIITDNGIIIADLKSTVDASKEEFERSIWDRRYHVQAAWYSEGFERATNEKPDAFTFIAQEKEEPFLSAIYVASPAMLEVGRKEFTEDMSIYASCVAKGKWPGYPEKAQLADLPPWAMKKSGEA